MLRVLSFALFVLSCTHRNPYETASEKELAGYKETIIPLSSGTKFRIGYSPFRESNKMYSWAFNVPYGTKVVAVEDGMIALVKAEGTRGGCAKENEGHGHLIRILHPDGTVSQYLHLNALVKPEENVKRGQIIATTALNGLVCAPNLHFMVYKNTSEVSKGNRGKTVPLRFKGIPGLAILDYEGTVP